jgi:hypothetical protein
MLNQHFNGRRLKIFLELTDRNGKMLIVINIKASRGFEAVPFKKIGKIILHIFLNVKLVNSHTINSVKRKLTENWLLTQIVKHTDLIICHF